MSGRVGEDTPFFYELTATTIKPFREESVLKNSSITFVHWTSQERTFPNQFVYQNTQHTCAFEDRLRVLCGIHIFLGISIFMQAV